MCVRSSIYNIITYHLLVISYYTYLAMDVDLDLLVAIRFFLNEIFEFWHLVPDGTLPMGFKLHKYSLNGPISLINIHCFGQLHFI